MARSRNIKPAIMDNEALAELEPLTRLLFIYLWMLADRDGRLEDRPKRIAAQALPYDRAADVNSMLFDLQAAGFIARYTANGVACIQVLSFSKHQTPHVREAASELPSMEQGTTKAVPEHNLGSAEASPRSPDSLIPDSLIGDSTSPDGDPGAAQPLKAEPCPYDAIVMAYHEALPELPRVKLMEDKRKKAMRDFWAWIFKSRRTDGQPRATNGTQALAWVETYFSRASTNDFLMGRSRTGGREWRADFDFLLTDKGRKHVIEKSDQYAEHSQ